MVEVWYVYVTENKLIYRRAPFLRAVNFANLPKNQFRRFNFCKFMPPAILYYKNLIFAEVFIANLKKLQNPALEKRRPTVGMPPKNDTLLLIRMSTC